MKNYKNIPICIDFDGTIVEHEYPKIGDPVPLAIKTIKELEEQGALLILFTMRSDQTLREAVNFLKENNINLYGVNYNPSQSAWTKSPKAYGHIYIDDAALGCPLVKQKGKRDYVDWVKVREMLEL